MNRTIERPATARLHCAPGGNFGSVYVSQNESSSRGWSDAKADAVGVLVVFAALVLGAIYFISGGA